MWHCTIDDELLWVPKSEELRKLRPGEEFDPLKARIAASSSAAVTMAEAMPCRCRSG